MNEVLLAGNIKDITSFKFQEVTTKINGVTYLKTLNIIIDDKTIKKIRFDDQELVYQKGMGEKIILQKVSALLTKNNNKRKHKKQKVSKQAAGKAATDLLNNLGL
jgi:hypothetical protein